ncbi:MAG: hypothetical protein ACOYOA_09345, partial [Saprospiraceae bacterium]
MKLFTLTRLTKTSTTLLAYSILALVNFVTLSNANAQCLTCTNNLIVNGNFNTNVNSWTAYNGSISRITAYQQCSSSGSLSFDWTSGTGGFYQDLTTGFSAGTALSLNFWAGVHVSSFDAQFGLEFYNGSTFISKSTLQIDKILGGTPSMQNYTINATVPANTTKVRIIGTATGDFLKVDELCLNVVGCSNVTTGGVIGANQVGCNPYTSSPITEVTAPIGGAGALEYTWLKSTTASTYTSTNAAQWTTISGATSSSYNPGVLTQITYFVRLVRRANCTEYKGVSNVIKIEVYNPVNYLTNPGFETNADATKFNTVTTKLGGSTGSRALLLSDAVAADKTYVKNWAPAPKVFYVKKDAKTNNPEGEYFFWLPNKDQCLVMNNGVLAQSDLCPGKQYTLCFKAAAWRQALVNFVPQNTTSTQSNVKLQLEAYTNASPSTLINQGSWTLPASTSWTNLNWQSICYTFVYDPSNPITQFVFSNGGSTSGAADVGYTIDDLSINSTNCEPCFYVPDFCSAIKAPAGICYSNTNNFFLKDAASAQNYNIKAGTSPLFTRYDNGNARMQATIVKSNDANYVYELDITFTGETLTGTPKIDTDCSKYPDPSDTLKYYTTATGSLVGVGTANVGSVVQLTRSTNAPFQVGRGASTNSAADGGSGWMKAVANSGFGNGMVNIEFDFNCGCTVPDVTLGNVTKTCNIQNSPGTTACNNVVYGFYLATVPTTTLNNEAFIFTGTPKFIEYDNGTAQITGTVQSKTNANIKYDVVAKLSGKTTTAPAGSPKSESGCYTINPTGWEYYTTTSGTLTSVGTTNVGNLSFSRMGPAFQKGIGASLRDQNNMSASGWLDVVDANCQHFQGDFNFTIKCCSAAVTVSNNGPKCADSNVTLTAVPTGTTGTVQYAWSGPNNWTSTAAAPVVTVAGTYALTITDGSGCSAVGSTVVRYYSKPVISATVTSVTSTNGTNGAITITVTGGTSPYTYLWSDGITTANRTNLIAGVYSLIVKDSRQCGDTLSTELDVDHPFPCTGFRTQTQGGWGAVPNGGNNGQYLHTNFATAFPTGLTIGCATGGMIKLTTAQAVTDFLPSGSTARALSAGTLTNPGSLYSNVLAGQVAALSLSVGFDNAIPSFGSSSQLLKNLFILSGPFVGWSVQKLLDEANKKLGGCASAYSFAELNDAVTKVNENFSNGKNTGNYLGCCSISVTVSNNGPKCIGTSVTLSAVASGTTGTLTYKWAGPGTFTSAVATPSVTVAGTYLLTVTDSNGCVATGSTVVSAFSSAPTVSPTSIGAEICEGTNANLKSNPSGGTPPYTFKWSGPLTFNSTDQNPTLIITSASQNGTYVVTVTDANGCTGTGQIGVKYKPSPVVTASGTSPCAGGTITFSASATVSLGTITSYKWSGPNGFTSTLQNPTITNANPTTHNGTYTVSVTSSYGCVGTKTVNIAVVPTTTIPTITLGNLTKTCSILNSPGTAPCSNVVYGFWMGAVPTTTLSNEYFIFIGSPTFKEYDNGTAQILGTVQSKSNAAIKFDVVASFSGKTTTTPAGSPKDEGCYPLNTSGWEYYTTTSGTLTSIGTTNVGNFSFIRRGPSMQVGLGASLRDANNRSASGWIDVINQNCQKYDADFNFTLNCCNASVVVSNNGPKCIGTSVTLSAVASGTTGTLTYKWAGPGTFTSAVATPSVTVAGTYLLTVTDSNGCVATGSTVVSAFSSAPTVSPTSIGAEICEGTNANLKSNPSGGTPPYTFKWSGPLTFNSTDQNPTLIITSASQNGTYVVTVTDANGCTGTGQIGVKYKPSPVVTASGTSPCAGGTITFSASATVSLGTITSYKWSGPNGFTSTLQNPTITNANPTTHNGTYTVSVTSSYGCVGTKTVNIAVVPTTTIPTITLGNLTKTCSILNSPGTAPCSNVVYGFWMGAVPTTTLSNEYFIFIGSPTFKEYDNGTAQILGTVQSKSNAAIKFDVVASFSGKTTTTPAGSPKDEGCYPLNTSGWEYYTTTSGTLTSIGTTNVGNFSFIRRGPSMQVGLGASLRDANNRSASGWIDVINQNCQKYDADFNFTLGCCNTSVVVTNNGPRCIGSPVTLTATPVNTTAPYTYKWSGPSSFSSTAANPTVTVAGTYFVTVVDSKGCNVMGSTTVTTFNGRPNVTPTSGGEVCEGSNANLKSNPSGGTPPYTFNWSGPSSFSSTDQNPTLIITTANQNGTYVVTVTDANGCTGTGQVGVKFKPRPVVTASGSTPCEGGTIVFNASATVSLGTIISYSWSGPNGFTSNLSNPTINNANPALHNGTYTVTVTSSYGCTGIKTVPIVVKPKPVAVINNITPNCVNSAISFTANDAGVGATYSWSFGSGASMATATGIGPHNVTYSICGTRDVGLTVTLNGCSITTSKTINTTDNIPPIISNVPTNVTVECSNIPTVPTDISVSDNCPNPALVYMGETSTKTGSANTDCSANSYVINRTWNATDACGNSVTKAYTITVQDKTKPVLANVPSNVTVECSAIPQKGTPTASDNCDLSVDIAYSEVKTNGSCTDSYTLTRTWTATDNCGNKDTKTQIITVRDTQKPLVSNPPSDLTLECGAPDPGYTPQWTDNCDNDLTLTAISGIAQLACGSQVSQSYSAEDNCGNKTTVSRSILYIDTTKPVLSNVPANVTLECDMAMPTSKPTASDICDGTLNPVYSEQFVPGICENSYQLIRRWVATDRCNNSISAQQVVTVRDTKAPLLAGIPANVTVECNNVPNPGTPTATDNCDATVDITYAQTRTNGNCVDSYTLTRTWTATDNCGNKDTKTQVITVRDTQRPTLAGVPANTTVECNNVPNPGTPTATDNCDATVDITYNQTRTNGNCPDAYTLTRTWTATDNCGNSTSASQVITVRDTQKPVLAGVPANTTVECNNVPNPGTPTATDNCDASVDITYNQTRTNGNCPDAYTLTRTWTATDNCGNSTSASQVITVRDTQKPVLAGVPANTTVECNAVPAVATPTATDNCDDNVDITYNQSRTNGTCTDSYTLTRTWTATDNCGNSTSASQVITVRDTQKPVLAGVPANTTVECNNVPNPGTPTATDNCDDNVDITYNQTRANGNCPDAYTLTRTWTATDNCGNSTSASQVITVRDTQRPTIAGVPANTTVECNNVPNPGTPTATDNCDATVDITYNQSRTNGTCTDSYTLTRTWTATDNCGNSTSASQVITVRDTQKPTLAGVPANTTVECNAVPAVATPTATDNCDDNVDITYNQTRANGNCPDAFTLTRTWTATDNCGNSTSASQVITVRDTQKPVLAGVPANTTVECNNVPNPGTPTATDNCDDNVDITYNQSRTN